ncbi:MAG TPA: hypothetical protein VE713_19025 [Pyrinomonadaceae bacterium]|jgi:hypothetical protein|nr:hypothetical protein [Pyrinomonadaceae bacterium]
MAIQILVQQAGPLPIKTTFQAPSDAPIYLEVNGSVWSQSANVVIGIGVNLDDQEVGHARIFSNGTATHRAVVPAFIPIKIKQGQHTLSLFPDTTQTISDFNDFYTVVIHY